MELLFALLYIIGFMISISISLILITLIIHSAIFNQWKWNFSKEGLKYHLRDYIGFMIVGTALMFGFSIVKGWFTKD
jgi:hypothetical protein